ncbi:MAG: HDOD domain-containing protein, partial [Phycisphaerales bacterium]|nr:HDOD domain-containing protein [Phycisphaerales bacterium]
MPPKDIFKRLEATGRLPTPAGVVVRLLEVTRRQDVSIEEIAEVIGADPGLTGKIIRFVNSPMAGLAREITSLHQAV